VTGADSEPLGFADQVFFSDGKGNPVTPPAANIYNPDPQAHRCCPSARCGLKG
jgi:phospholipase C